MANWKYHCSALRKPAAARDEALLRIEPKVIVVVGGKRASAPQYRANSNQAAIT